MNELMIFDNPEFGEIRTFDIDGEPWFVAKDVCDALEILNHKDALTRLDIDEKSGVVLTDPHGREQTTNCVNEPGLYSLILGSRKPEAKAFKRWITHEVIPAIRKTGSYSAKSSPDQKRMEAEAKLNNSRARIAAEMRKLAALAGTPDTYKQVLTSKAAEIMTGHSILPLPNAPRTTYSATQVGERYGITSNMVGRIANQHELKTDTYGLMVWDKSPNSAKEVQAWQYYDTVFDALDEILGMPGQIA